ncbi:MAG: bifunctional methionine sulfoxide reductase B/A protein, partial [Candidatus Aminicenantes bacterium]|nr:bifunctional methionine sulfoxide reductase B/A protein [Candidatus Aminicenantes bacterium]
MKFKYILLLVVILITMPVCAEEKMENKNLTDLEKYVIENKGTEKPFTGKYNKHKEEGTYTCKRCDAPLYRSSDKFESDCGWPSFDDEIKGAVKRIPDADGRRTEIVCANCDAHLGHVFFGEKYTARDTRHCVNSVSMNFVPAKTEKRTETAVFASGCFWGSEYHFERKKGVISTRAGYTGGTSENVSYEEVCSGTTGHAEAVEVVFDPSVISYEELAKLYFNTHDPSQLNRQGPDIGTQYRSEIFYESKDQKKTAEKLIKLLKDKGINVVTALSRSGKFWEAEKYHQNYYRNKGGTPYCH